MIFLFTDFGLRHAEPLRFSALADELPTDRYGNLMIGLRSTTITSCRGAGGQTGQRGGNHLTFDASEIR